MTDKKEILFNRFWFQEVVSLIMKLHPVILFLLGWLDSKESFLVLILGYLIYALRIQVIMGISFVYDYKLHVLRAVNRTMGSKIGSLDSRSFWRSGFLFTSFFSGCTTILLHVNIPLAVRAPLMENPAVC